MQFNLSWSHPCVQLVNPFILYLVHDLLILGSHLSLSYSSFRYTLLSSMAAVIWFKLFTRPDDDMFFFFIPFYTKLTCIISTAEIIALDVWAVTCQDDWVITSPNVKYVPQAHIFYDKNLHAQADSCFGLMDCFQWPQSYVKDYSHAVCIPWKDTLPTYTIAWYTPTHNNFVTAAGSLPSVGLLQEDSVQMLEQLFKLLCTWHHPIKHKKAIGQSFLHQQMWSAEHDIMCLQLHPLKFRDLVIFVAQLRTLLDIHVMLKFIKILSSLWNSPPSKLPHANPMWMRCFTMDTQVCERMYFAGVPVWLVCHKDYILLMMNIVKPVQLMFPNDIIKTDYSKNGWADQLCFLFHGPDGPLHQWHTQRYYQGTFVNAPEPVVGPSTSNLLSSNILSSNSKQHSMKRSRAAREKVSMAPFKGV